MRGGPSILRPARARHYPACRVGDAGEEEERWGREEGKRANPTRPGLRAAGLGAEGAEGRAEPPGWSP